MPLLGLCVVVAHLPYLVGLVDPNPLLQQSAIGIHLQSGLLPGNDTDDPNTGFTSQALAHRAILDWLHGHVPWWNPFEGVGSPLAAELQCAAFFPFIIFLALSGGQVYLYLVLCLIAAYSTYFLLRRLSLNPWACFAGGVAFGLNGTFSWFRYAPSNPVCFLPLILLGVELVRERAALVRDPAALVRDPAAPGQVGFGPVGLGRVGFGPVGLGRVGFGRVGFGQGALERGAPERARGWRLLDGPWWIIAAGVALSILAGFVETTYLDGLVVVLWLVVRLSGLKVTQARRYLSSCVAGALAGVLIAAPVLVAFVDYYPAASLGNNGGNLTRSFLPGKGLGTLLFPYVFGPIWGFQSGSGGQTVGNIWGGTGGYLTVALLLLALVGLLGRRHRPLKVALAAWSAILVARSYGVVAVADTMNVLPGIRHVFTARFMNPGLSLCVAVLAAFGVADLLERRVGRRRLLLAAGVVAIAAVAVGVRSADLDNHIRNHVTVWELVSFAWALGTAAVVLFAGWAPGSQRLASWAEDRSTRGGRLAARSRRMVAVVIVALLPVEAMIMFIVPELSAPRSGRVDMDMVDFLRQNLGTSRFATLGPISPNYGSYFGLAELNENDLPLPKNFAKLVTRDLDPNANPVLFTGTSSADKSGLTPEEAFDAYTRNYAALGVKYVVVPWGKVPLYPSGVRVDPVYADAVAAIYRLSGVAPFFADRTRGCAVHPSGEERVVVDCSRPSTLVRNELEIRGWTASVDGRAEALGTSKLYQETLSIPAGRHVVTYDFAPAHAGLAWVGAALGILAYPLVIVGRWVWALLARRRRRHAAA